MPRPSIDEYFFSLCFNFIYFINNWGDKKSFLLVNLLHEDLPHTPNTKWHLRWCFFVVGVFPMPYHMLNTKSHPCWCDFVFGFFSSLYHTRRTRNDTFVRGRHVFYALPHMPNAKSHLRWCDFVFGFFSSPYHTRRTRNDTLLGVISCLDPSLPPRMNFKGCLLNIFLYY